MIQSNTLKRMAERFNNTNAWLEEVKKYIGSSNLGSASKLTYLSTLRSEIILRDFNGHHGPKFTEQQKGWNETFRAEWLALDPLDQYKFYRKGKRDKEKWAVELDYLPETFKFLSFDKLLPDGLVQEVKKKRRDSRKEKFKKENLIWIRKPKEFLEHVLSGLLSEDPAKLLPALLLSTGLRMSDIYFGAVCKPVQNEKFQMRVESKLKMGCRLSSQPKCDNIYLLCEYSIYERALKKFRSLFPTVKTSFKASTLRCRQNKRWCNEVVSPYVENFKRSHSLRAIYAKFAYILFGRQEREGSFFQKMLLHESDITSTEYETVKIPEEEWGGLRPFTEEKFRFY